MVRSRVVVLVLSAALTSLAAPAVAQDQGSVVRVGDAPDLVTMAVAVSQAVFDEERAAQHVVIGRDDVFPDNLAAAPLAGFFGPLLYTTGGPDAPLRPEVLAEVQRVLGPARGECTTPDGFQAGAEVYLAGGTAAVSSAAEQAVAAEGYCVVRLGGEDRFQTARAIAEETQRRTGSRRAVVARADDWADAATGGAAAANLPAPIMITGTDALHPEAEAFLGATEDFGPPEGEQPLVSAATILGGPVAVSQAVEDAIRELTGVSRVQGDARDHTAIAIRDQLWTDAGPRVVLVNGYAEDGWAYALAAASLSSAGGGPQLYTQTGALTPATCAVLADAGIEQVTVVGPPSAVGDAVMDQARAVIAGGGC